MKRLLSKFGFYASVFVLVSPAVLVFLWMISLSLKNELDNTAFPPVFIPNPPTFANYLDVFEKNNFALYLWNSILVTGGAVLVGLAVGVPAGYGIARGTGRYQQPARPAAMTAPLKTAGPAIAARRGRAPVDSSALDQIPEGRQASLPPPFGPGCRWRHSCRPRETGSS